MTKGRSCGIARSKWFVPLFSLVLGLVMLAVSWSAGSADGAESQNIDTERMGFPPSRQDLRNVAVFCSPGSSGLDGMTFLHDRAAATTTLP
jgi:hypothetical protein